MTMSFWDVQIRRERTTATWHAWQDYLQDYLTVPGETVNRLCSSGLSAIVHAHRAIQTGDGDVFIAGGVENMTRGPMVIAKPSSAFGTDKDVRLKFWMAICKPQNGRNVRSRRHGKYCRKSGREIYYSP